MLDEQKILSRLDTIEAVLRAGLSEVESVRSMIGKKDRVKKKDEAIEKFIANRRIVMMRK